MGPRTKKNTRVDTFLEAYFATLGFGSALLTLYIVLWVLYEFWIYISAVGEKI